MIIHCTCAQVTYDYSNCKATFRLDDRVKEFHPLRVMTDSALNNNRILTSDLIS